jgi:uncharacterized repeat protein (TIGR01451 family)
MARLLLAALAMAAGVSGPLMAQSADLSILKVDTPDPVTAGSSLVYSLSVSNEGPDDASSVVVSDPLPAGTSFASLAAPAGWSCTDPGVGANGTVSCSIATFSPGGAVFTLTVTVGTGVANGTVLSNTATVTSATSDPHPGTESATADTTVVASTTAIALTKADSPDPVLAGADLTYTITASNNGGGDLEQAQVSDTLPAGTTFVSWSSPAGWSCGTPAVGSAGTVTCTAAPWAPGAAVFTLVVHVAPGTPGGSSLSNVAHLDVTDSGRSTSQTASAVTQVLSPAAVSATKTVAGQLVSGGAVTYTVVLPNAAAQTQGDNPGAEFTDVLPAQLTLVSATATSGTAVATVATNTVTWDGSIPGGSSVTITIQATIKAETIGSTVSNQGTAAYDADGDGTNEASAVTDDPTVVNLTDPTVFTVAAQTAAEVPALGGFGLALLAVLLAAGGVGLLRRTITSLDIAYTP